MVTIALGLLLAAAPGGSLDFGWQHETGVMSRATVTVSAWFPVTDRLALDAGAGFSLFEHRGLAAWGAGARFTFIERWRIAARVACQHEQWNDWRAGENRVIGTVQARPFRPVELEIGLAWRAPVFDPETYWSPLAWSSDVPELNIVYRLDWRFLEGPGWDVSVGAASFDGLHLRNPQHAGLYLVGRHRLDDGWRLFGRFGTAVKGVSSPLLSADGFTARLGVERDF